MRCVFQNAVGEGLCPSRAGRNCKIARIFGENVKRPVGADDPVRPMGNHGFAAAFHKNGPAAGGESAASTPTNVVRFRIGTFVFASVYRRADRGVRPYGCGRIRMGAREFAALYRAGGVEPRPYANWGDLAKK